MVLHAHVEDAGVQVFDLAGETIAVLHHNYIGALAREGGHGQKKCATQNDAVSVSERYFHHALPVLPWTCLRFA
jgi:hypothetical protein